LVAAAVVVPWLMPREPVIRVVEGFAVLPRGGGGTPEEPAPAAKAPEAKPEPVESAAPPPPPVVLKPPPKAEPRPNALPLPNARAQRQPPTPPPVRATQRAAPSTGSAATGSTAAGRGTSSATPGLQFGPATGPGVPTGTDSGGDWYLAGVQQKIWMLWSQQLKGGYTQSVGVTFTIQPNGEVTSVKVTQPSGISMLDMAAARAIQNASPFGPLPREYGQNPRTIEAIFKPTT
jgi:protein TonB